MYFSMQVLLINWHPDGNNIFTSRMVGVVTYIRPHTGLDAHGSEGEYLDMMMDTL